MDDNNCKSSGPRLVASTDTAEIARRRSEDDRQFAIDKLKLAVTQLAANMLRTIAGGGSTYDIVRQISEVIHTFVDLKELGEPYPGLVINETLRSFADRDIDDARFTDEDRTRWHNDGTFDREYAVDRIVTGALRLAASRALGQRTQERSGEKIIYESILALEDARAKADKYHRR
jgi:hypothetical protein